ncbi:hypothetical protein BHE74_00013076 [Ensete ventricosum]|nr:hypothetical protein BHE74_00013076 [Ensete ventricosum]
MSQGLDDVVGDRREFARRFAEGIEKLARNTPGDHRKKTVRLTARDSRVCQNAGVRSLSLVVELNWLTKELVSIKFKPEFEKWREPFFRRFRRVNR